MQRPMSIKSGKFDPENIAGMDEIILPRSSNYADLRLYFDPKLCDFSNMGGRAPICLLALLLILGGLTVRASAQEPSHEPDASAARPPTTRIDAVRFVGASSVPALDLTKAVVPWLHRELGFDQMNEMAAAVTSLYRSRGYMVASAYLAAQKIHDHVLTITVVEGRVGTIRLRSNKTAVSDEQLRATLEANLCDGDCAKAAAIRQSDIERAALIVNAIPGVAATYELAPGQRPGTTDLLLDAKKTDDFAVTVGADNNGFALTGRRRASLAVNASNLFGRGDQIAFSSTYTGKGFLAFSADASLPFGYRGARLGATGGHLRYALGGEFAVLGATGVSDQIGFYGSYPLARTLERSMDLRFDLLAKSIHSNIDAPKLKLRSTQSAVELMVAVSGSQLDRVFASASTQYRFAWTTGELRLGTPTGRASDALAARTNGSFGKFSYLVQREEFLAQGLTLFGRVSGQYATTNLDSSEKFPLGGAQGVRAYDTGAAAADIATLLSIEGRIRAPASLTGPWEITIAPFYDHAWLTQNKRRWNGFIGENQGQMAGVGLYASLVRPGRYSLRATYARRVRTSDDIVPGADERAWLEAAALF